MDSLSFEKVGEIPIFSDGYSLVARSVADDGSLLFLFVEPGGSEAVVERHTSGIGIFPRARMAEPKKFRMVRLAKGLLQIVELPPLDVTFPQVDLFPDGRVLVVAPRSQWRAANDYDLNGAVFDPATGATMRFLLGDGINRCQVDGTGRIWVSYSDEGVFGNFGWANPGPQTIGGTGLVCFSATGEKIWEYPVTAEPHIFDCYALNVSGTEVTAYFYDEFPVCRVSRDFRLTYWKTTLNGCHEFAISNSQMLFSGQYRDPPSVGYRGTLEAGALGQIQPIKFLLPNGSPLPRGRLLGRGNSLYFFDAESAYRLSIG